MASIVENITFAAQTSATYRKNILNNSVISGATVTSYVNLYYEYLDTVWKKFTQDEVFTGSNTTTYDNFKFKAGSFSIRAVYQITDNNVLVETLTGANVTLTLAEIKPTIVYNSSLGACVPHQTIVTLPLTSYLLNLPTGTPTITYTITANDGSLISGSPSLVFTKTASGAYTTLSLTDGNFPGWNTFLTTQVAKKSYTITAVLNNNNFSDTQTFQLNICDNYKVEYIDCNQVKITNYNSNYPLIVELKQFSDSYSFVSIVNGVSTLDAVSIASNTSTLIQLPQDNLYRFKSSFNSVANITELVILDCNMNKCKVNVINNYFKFKDTCDAVSLRKLQIDFLEFISLEYILRGKWAYYKNQRVDIEVNAINEASNLLSLKTTLDRLNSICSSCGRLDVTICDTDIVTNYDFTGLSSDCGCK